MAEEFKAPEAYNSTNIDNRQQGYSPASPVGDGLDPALASALGSNAGKSMSDIFREVDAESEARYKPQAIQAAKRISAFNAFEQRHKETMFDIQKQNLALQWESAQRRRREVESALRQNGYMSANTNPDEEAMINGIASTLGVSVEAVRSNPEEYKRRLSAQQLAKLAASNPSVSSFMADQQNAAIAHDDVENMSALEYGWSMVKDIGRGLIAGVAESPKTIVGTAYQYGLAQAQASEMEMLSVNPEAISSDEYTGRLQSAQDEIASTGFMETAKDAYRGIKELGDWIQGDRWQQYGIIGRGLVGGARSLGNQVLPFKGGKLFSALPLVAGGLAENTNAFMEDIAQGRGYGTAAAHGAFSGSVEVLTEKIPMSWWMSDAAKAMPFWKKLAKGWARETPTEMIATTFQNLADVSAETAGSSFGDFITGNMDSKAYGDMFSKYWRELPTALAETAVSVFPMSLGFSGLTYHRQAKAAEQGRRAIDAIQDAGKKSKLLARDQDTYKKLARTVADDKGITEVGIEKEAWDSYFQNNVGVDPAQAAKEFGIENYDEAETTGHIAMKPDVYSAEFCKAGHIPALADFTTLQNGETLTINEVNERAKEIASQAAREIEAIKQSEKVGDKWADVSSIINNVEEQIRYELEGTGMTLKSADIQAKLMSRFLTTTLVRNAVQLAGEQNREVDTKEIAKSIRDEIFGKGFQITRGNLVARKNVEPHLDSLLEKLRKSNPAKMARQAYGETLAQFVRRNGGLIPTKDLRDKVSKGELPQSIISKKSKNGADTMALLAKEAGYSFNEETRQIDDDLVEQLMEEHKGGQVNYSMANRNDALAMEIAVLGSLQTDIGIAGIDLNNTENAEVRRLLAEFDGEKYGREDSRAVPETEETGGQVDVLNQATRGFVANENATPEEIAEANRQYDEIKKYYDEHPEQFKKAPNGADSNLDDVQWIRVRTRNFRNYFGDWLNSYMTSNWFNVSDSKEILNMPAVNVGSIEKIENKNEIKTVFSGFGDVVNKNDGVVIKFAKNSAGKAVFVRNYVKAFKTLFETSKRAWSETHTKDVNHKEKRNLISAHQYINKFTDDSGNTFFIRFTVREESNSSDINYHSAVVSDVSVYKENGASATGELDLWETPLTNGKRPFVDKKLSLFFNEVNRKPVSKVIDENGEPKVVYHGTATEDITEFSHRKAQDKTGRAMAMGQGKGKFYIATTKMGADMAASGAVYRGDGKTPVSMPLFVNERNPISLDEYKRLYREMSGHDLNEKYSDGYTQKDRDNFVAKLDKQLKKDGVDGLYDENAGFVAPYNPNQIKSATGNSGTFKRDNDNIYYQSSDTQPRMMAIHTLSAESLKFADSMGGLAVPSIAVTTEDAGDADFGAITLIGNKSMADPASNPVYSSDAYTARFPRPVYKKGDSKTVKKVLSDLYKVADEYESAQYISSASQRISSGKTVDAYGVERDLRNCMGVKVKFLRDNGIEVEKKYRPARRFDLLSPEDTEKLRTYVDAWFNSEDGLVEGTPEFKALADKYRELYIESHPLKADRPSLRKLQERMATLQVRDAHKLFEDFYENDGKEKFDPLATEAEIEEKMSGLANKFQDYITDTVNSLVSEPMLEKGRGFVPYTLDNIVESMKSNNAKNKEESFNYGFGEARAQASLKFSDIEVMREHAAKNIVNSSEYAELKKKAEETISEYRFYVSDTVSYHGDEWGSIDASMKALAKFATKKNRTVSALKTALKSEGFDVSKLSDEKANMLFKIAYKSADALLTTPVPYFEAKPQRAVGLNEFAGAVIPSNASEAVREILDKNNIPYTEYSPTEDRNQVVRDFAKGLSQGGADTLFQRQDDANGATRIMRDANGIAQQMRIELYKTANFSTFAHESSHFMLEVISGMVAEGRASQYLNGEFDTIMKYLGTDKESWLSMDAKEKEDYHEKFARSFERYLLEGKAPIPELRSIFRVFKDWLTYIYRNLKTLDFKLSKDITGVFDRMIASDEEIARAKAVDNLSMLASSADDLGVSQQEFKTLSNMMNEELAVANEKVRARLLKSEVRKQQKQYKAEKAKAQKQAEKEWNESDFVQTLNYFTDNEDRTRALNKQALVATYGEEFIKTLPKINGRSVYHENGTSFHDEMAADLGFESSEDFIKAIAEMQPKKQWVEERTQQIIDDFFGDTVNSAEVSETVDEAMNNSAKEERLTMELKILNKAKRFADVGRKSERRETKQANKEARDAGKAVDKETSEMVEAMKLAADTFVKETNMRDFNPNKWLNAMRKWSRLAKQELMKAKPDYAKAMEYKRSELCSYYSYVYSVKAKDAIRKKTAEARNILRKPLKDILKTRTAGIVYHAKSVAAKLLGRDATQWEEKTRIEMKYEDGIDADQTVTALKDMTVEQAIANLNYCSGLWELSRRDQQMRVNDKLYDIEMVKKELSETITAFGKTNREYNSRDGAADTFKRLYGNALVDLTRMESWCDMVDGNEVGKETGALTRYIFAPMKICAENSRRKQAQYNKRLAEILEKVQVGKGTIKADELNGFVFGEKTGYAKLEIFHALLHCGNKSNMERLIIGRGWGQYLADGSVDTTQWSKFVQRLIDIGYFTEADMDAAQEIWDLFDELKPEMQKANKEVFGNYFDEIEPDQFEMFGKTYKGGYVPAIYDPELSDAGKNQELNPTDLMNAVTSEKGGSVLAKLQAGWRNTRVKGVAGALLLDVSKLGTHLNQQIQFAEIAPTAKDVAKVISSEEFKTAIDGYDPFFYQNVIVPWFSRAVTQNVSGNTGIKRTEEEKLLQRIRNRAGIATMFMNVVNAIEGFFDLTAVYSKVKAAHIHDAFKQMATNRKATVESVLEMSPYMKERLRSEANAAMEKLDQALRPSKLRKVENWMADHAYFLQEMVDNFTAPTAWLAAYNQASENGIAHDEAVLQADSVVRQTFGTNNAEDLANREVGGIWKRLFTQFTGYFVQRANLIAGKLTKISDSDMAIADKRKSVFFLLLQSVFLPAWIGGVIRKAAMGAAPWDEDEDGNSLFAQWMKDVFGWTVASYVVGLGGVTAYGRVASTAIDAYTSERMASGRVFSSPMMKPIEDVMKIATGVVSKKDGSVNVNKLVNATAGALNLCPILPVVPNKVLASGKYIVKSATGDIKPTGAVDFVRGAITGKASAGTESKR